MSEYQYLDACAYILENGSYRQDRTGVGTYAVLGIQMRFNLSDGFPLLTTKKMPFGLIKSELLWFVKGMNNIRYLLEHNNHIWNEWAFKRYVQSKEYKGPDMTDFGIRAMKDEKFRAVYEQEMAKFVQKILEDDNFAARWGDLGRIYGVQWRNWKYVNPETGQVETVDQFAEVVEELKTNPYSRRLIVNAWHPGENDFMALPPCHKSFQFFVADGKLSCLLEQRSGDMFLGVPFNIASYALLTHLVAREVGLEVGELVHNVNDAHIYSNHVEQVKTQLERVPYPFPELVIEEDAPSLFDMGPEHIKIKHYQYHPKIHANVAV